jgi:Ca2+-binding RTX toxin-like protein
MDTASYVGASAAVNVNLSTGIASGGDGTDTLSAIEAVTGSNFDDTLTGTSGNDTLTGGNGNDILVGGFGKDRLIGGAGADQFVFNTSKEGIDTLTDFTISEGDQIVVSAAGFGGGLLAGNSIQLALGTTPTQASGQLLYNSSNGQLFFDIDGTGLNPPIQIATLSNKPALSMGNFLVV